VEGALAEHEFVFKNMGSAPIVITNVRASCGCTTPQWTKEPIPPGQTGTIKAVFNSTGRPGAFNKSITVTSNATESVKVLKISGTVSSDPAKQAQLASERGMKAAGDALPAISLLEKSHNFGTIQRGQGVKKAFRYTNTGQGDLSLTSIFSRCKCVSFKTDKTVLKPGETATMELTYTPNALTDKPERVYFSSNAPYDANMFIELKAIVVESLAPKSILQESGGAGF
jgi:hypothetical protein